MRYVNSTLVAFYLLLLSFLPALAQDVWLTGDPVPVEWMQERLQQRGWSEFPSRPLRPGQSWKNSDGERVIVLDWAPPKAAIAALSDHPEKVERVGGLFFGGLTTLQPVLFQYYHLGKLQGLDPNLALYITNPGSETAKLYFQQGIGTPSLDYFSTGHTNNTQWFAAQNNRLGEFVNIGPGETKVVLRQELTPEYVVSGMVGLTLVEGPALQFAFVAKHDDEQAIALNNLLKEDDVHSRGFYPLPRQKFQRTFIVGEPPMNLAVGAMRQQTFSGVKELRGDYGVVYQADIILVNPESSEADVEFVFNPRGGAATATFKINNNIVEVPKTEAFQESPFYTVHLSPNSETKMTLETIPEGASSYPIRVILRTK